MRVGLETPKTTAERHLRIIVYPDASDRSIYTLDPLTRTARITPLDLIGLASGGGRSLIVPIGGVRFLVFRRAYDLLQAGAGGPEGYAVQHESLGSRRIAGVETTGQRIALTVPSGQFGNNLATELVDEEWESPELKILIYSRYSDSRTGVIEYRLTNIRRTEPPSELFLVPPDYTIDRTPTPEDPWLSLTSADHYGAQSQRRLKR